MLTDHELIIIYEKSHYRESAGTGQDTFSDGEGVSSGIQTFQGKSETFVRFSNP